MAKLLKDERALFSEFDFSKNAEIDINTITLGSNKKVWWTCNTCGYSWASKVNDRANGKGCPICAKKKRIKSFRENTYLKRGENDLATLRPDLIEEWDYSRNQDIIPNDFTCNSIQKVWWKCSICGNEWEATISNRVNRNSGCPKCKKYVRTSFPEQAILYYVQQIFPSAENSYTDIFYPTKRELDIYVPEIKVGIEYDGAVFHSDERAKHVGIEKYQVCKKNNINLIRVSESPDKNDDYDFFIYREGFTSDSLDNAIIKVIELLSDQKVDVNTERDRNIISKQYFGVIKSKSITAKYPDIAKEWDYEKNDGITPDMVNWSTLKKYWWKCEKGHSYQMSPSNKCFHNSRCPICSGRIVLSGFNDLKTKYPEIAEEWDYEKNYPLKAEDVASESVSNYWWICPQGHSYYTNPNSRTANKTNCPYCTGRKVLVGFNDIVSTNPDVVNYWDYPKNKELLPEQFSRGSHKKVWWVCPKGHEYEKAINSFIKYRNCPICDGTLLKKGVNDLGTTHPDLIEEWAYDNNTITPDSITRISNKRVWWKCNICGTTWQQKINVRVLTGCGCPKCGYKIKLGETRRKNKSLYQDK